jgi:hypothetical protein
MRYPDYENGILNIVCSLQKYLGMNTHHKSLTLCDAVLEKDYKNAVFMVFDGLGADALNYHLPPDSFLRQHTEAKISSVFPSTTTAAMTALYSGLSPFEHGWIGWSLYFEEVNALVNIFPNTLTDVPADAEVFDGKQLHSFRAGVTTLDAEAVVALLQSADYVGGADGERVRSSIASGLATAMSAHAPALDDLVRAGTISSTLDAEDLATLGGRLRARANHVTVRLDVR